MSTAARAVVGVQAQDVRPAALALRSRVPGFRRADVEGSGLIRTWTVRGTAHLIDPSDRPWLHAVLGPRNLARFDARCGSGATTTSPSDCSATSSRCSATARWTGPDCSAGWPPAAIRTWASARSTCSCPGRLPRGSWWACRTAGTGRPSRRPPSTSAWPWPRWPAATWRGTGATTADLASWSGLPLGSVRRGLAALGPIEADGDLLALPGTLDAPAPPAPRARLLAAFDTILLGYRRRAPLVAPEDDHHILPGGGMLRPAVLIDGLGAGTWRVTAQGGRRRVAVDWFRPHAESPELRAEQLSVETFLAEG